MLIDWKLSNVNFKDGRRNLVAYDNKAKGQYTIEEIRGLGQAQSDMLRKTNKDALIGIAYHFKDANVWIPAIMSSSGSPFEVYDVTDSPGNPYDGEVIDAIYYTVIKKDVINPVKFIKPNTGKPIKEINASIFDTKKKK